MEHRVVRVRVQVRVRVREFKPVQLLKAVCIRYTVLYKGEWSGLGAENK